MQYKFRGITLDGSRWVYGDYHQKRFNHHYITFYNEQDVFCQVEVIPETVGMFTGLMDKNGKEIYEGDLVSIPYVTPMGDLTNEENYSSPVGFKNGSFVCRDNYDTEKSTGTLSEWCKRGKKEYIPNYGEYYELLTETLLLVKYSIHDHLLKPQP
jgi:uncharacterized phage protein (TIGR01671 family)